MQRFVTPGSQNVSVVIRIVDATGATPETGVTSVTPGLSLWYRREAAGVVAISPVDLVALTDAHTDGGLLHIGAGYYRLDIPDAACTAGAAMALVGGVATDMVLHAALVQLSAVGEGTFDALMSDHDTPSTIGAYLARISTGRIVVASPIDIDSNITLVPGHDYYAADNCALEWTNAGEDWPSLAGATITFTVHNKLTKAGSCTNPGEAQQMVRVELTDTETATLTRGRSRFKVTATMPVPSGHVVLLVYGMATVADVVDAPAS